MRPRWPALALVVLLPGCAADAGRPLDPSDVDAGPSADAGPQEDAGAFDSGDVSPCQLPEGDLMWHPESDPVNEIRRLTTRVQVIGCTSYVAHLKLQWSKDFGPRLGMAEAEVYLCHMCPEEMTLHYLTGVLEPLPELLPFSDGFYASDFVIRAAEPSLGFGLVDSAGQQVSNQCILPDDIICTEEIARFVPGHGRPLIPPGRVLMLQAEIGHGYRPDQFPVLFDWRNEWRQSVGLPPVPPFNYRGELRLFFDLPHLYPTTTPSSAVRPERPDQLSCSFAGFPTPRNCGYWLNEAEWSPSDLLQLITPPIMLPEELLLLLRERAGQG